MLAKLCKNLLLVSFNEKEVRKSIISQSKTMRDMSCPRSTPRSKAVAWLYRTRRSSSLLVLYAPTSTFLQQEPCRGGSSPHPDIPARISRWVKDDGLVRSPLGCFNGHRCGGVERKTTSYTTQWSDFYFTRVREAVQFNQMCAGGESAPTIWIPRVYSSTAAPCGEISPVLSQS